MTIKKTLTIVAFLLTTFLSIAQTNQLSLLNNRFYCTFPDSAKNMARGTNIMSADANENSETRIVYDVGDKRMVFYAEELYLKSVADLETKLKAESTNEFPLTVKRFYNKDSVQCFSLTPATFERNENAILVNSMIVKNADYSLSKLSVYLNPKAFASRAEFDKITAQVFASYKKGDKHLNLNSHTDSFTVLGTKTKLKVKLPKDYIITVDKKYDFEVYKIRKVTSYGSEDQVDLTMYYGFYPSFFNTEFQLEKFKQPDSEVEFMFHKTMWMNFKDDSRHLILREQLFVDDDIQKDAQIHVAMISNNQNLIEECSQIVKDILLVYDK